MLKKLFDAFWFYMHKIKFLFIDNLLNYSRLSLIKYVECYKIMSSLTTLYDLDELFMII
jgi:hypothetical protein